MNLGSLNLNLLIVLDAVLQHRSVTRAAQQLHMSQPAVSASLSQLRRHFGDELLTRTGNDYRLTPLAVGLRERAHLALSSVERVFDAQRDFDPAFTSREFSIIASDYFLAVMGSEVAGILTAEAPLSRLVLLTNTPHMVSRAEHVLLGNDLLIVPHGAVYGLSHEDLYRDEWVCLISTDNTEVDDEVTLEHLKTLPWVATFHGPSAATPAALQMRLLGFSPTIQIVTESFLSVPPLIRGSNRIALLQRRLVDMLPINTRIRALPCPVEVGSLVEAMWWHPVYDEDREHAYLRGVIRRAAAQVRTAPAEATGEPTDPTGAEAPNGPGEPGPVTTDGSRPAAQGSPADT